MSSGLPSYISGATAMSASQNQLIMVSAFSSSDSGMWRRWFRCASLTAKLIATEYSLLLPCDACRLGRLSTLMYCPFGCFSMHGSLLTGPWQLSRLVRKMMNCLRTSLLSSLPHTFRVAVPSLALTRWVCSRGTSLRSSFSASAIAAASLLSAEMPRSSHCLSRWNVVLRNLAVRGIPSSAIAASRDRPVAGPTARGSATN
mmetsp:Transcript_20503/g.51988  ORF Transcript_20503/g.51988 Transcript_20503/m.51988 type:complete len:201 (+) Transcript_20503:653-1255(+)